MNDQLKYTFLLARETSVNKTGAIAGGNAKIKQKGRKNRLTVAATVLLLSTALSACETSQLLDVGDFFTPGASKTATAKKVDTNKNAQEEVAKAETSTEENIVLRGPAAGTATSAQTYPSLSDQPEKPEKTLSTAEKNREIRELQDTGKTHVADQETGLENRAAVEKPDEGGGIFGLGWLSGNNTETKPNTGKSGLTPPEKLRLARTKAVAPEFETAPDNISTDVAGLTPGLRRTPIIAPVPETEKPALKADAPKNTTPSAAVSQKPQTTANRPSAQKPKRIFFSQGSNKLTPSQQKPLDEIAEFRNNSGPNIYVLGFAQVDPAGNNEANIASQDLAIARANNVATGLRKRGFSGEQVVVQIIDEVPQEGNKSAADLRRVEVYFENTQAAKKSDRSRPEQVAKKSPLDFLQGTPFEPGESEN